MNGISKIWARAIEKGEVKTIRDVPEDLVEETMKILAEDGYKLNKRGEAEMK